MGASATMGRKKSTCLYLDAKVVETAKQMGLNVSRVSENALKETIELLKGPKRETALNGTPRVEGRDRDSDPGAGLHRPVG